MKITLSLAVEGFTLAAHARCLSKRTVADYSNTFRKLQKHLGMGPHALIALHPAGANCIIIAVWQAPHQHRLCCYRG